MVADDVPKKIPRMADELDEVLETPLSSPSNRKLKSRPSVMNGRGLAELKDVKLREKSFALSLAFLLGTHPARNAASVLGKGRFADGNAEDVLRLILHHLAIDLKGACLDAGSQCRTRLTVPTRVSPCCLLLPLSLSPSPPPPALFSISALPHCPGPASPNGRHCIPRFSLEIQRLRHFHGGRHYDSAQWRKGRRR